MKQKPVVVTLLAVIVAAGIWLWKSSAGGTDQHGRSAYAHTEAILACGPRPAGSAGLEKSQQYISAELAKHGWRTIRQSVQRDTPVGQINFVNLIARFQPGELATVDDLKKLPAKGILGAHLDSKLIPEIPGFLGADDAASACGLVIELAANLANNHPGLAKQLEIVFFDGEEAFGENITPSDGLYGSRAYSHTLYDRTPKPAFGIILDMVGHKDLRIAVPADTDPGLYAALTDAAGKHGHGKHFGMAKGNIIDDHLYLNKAGVPTIDIIGADFNHSDWWHQQGDNIELISAESLTISYHVTMTMLVDLLGRE